MSRSTKEFERVFGPESGGDTEDARAFSSHKVFVRSQLQIAEDNARATGQRLTAREAHWLYGWDILAQVAEDGAASLISMHDEPAATLKARREALNLSQRDVARAAGVALDVIARAETPGTVSPIRDLVRIAQKLGLNEYLLGYLRGAGGDKNLGVRLREMNRPNDIQHFSASDVLKLTEAAWVIATQSDLLNILGSGEQKSIRQRFEVDPDYRFPTYEKGYELAAKARRILGISPDEPIRSIKQVVEETLGIPVIQDRLAERFAGATVANGRDRGIVVNELGQNSNVWVRRMTVAHELGHLLWDPSSRLNRLRVDRYELIEDNPVENQKLRDPVEIRTNAFAITFLAPPSAMKKLSEANENEHVLLAKVVEEYGISATAAKYHLWNTARRDLSKVRLQQLPSPSDEWIAAENLTVDWFPIEETPISRRGIFAVLVVKAFEKGFISGDTAAVYLETSKARLLENQNSIISAGVALEPAT